MLDYLKRMTFTREEVKEVKKVQKDILQMRFHEMITRKHARTLFKLEMYKIYNKSKFNNNRSK